MFVCLYLPDDRVLRIDRAREKSILVHMHVDYLHLIDVYRHSFIPHIYINKRVFEMDILLTDRRLPIVHFRLSVPFNLAQERTREDIVSTDAELITRRIKQERIDTTTPTIELLVPYEQQQRSKRKWFDRVLFLQQHSEKRKDQHSSAMWSNVNFPQRDWLSIKQRS